MNVVLIAYDLHRLGQRYAEVKKIAESFDAWWHHLESTYIVVTNMKAPQVRDQFVPALDRNDELLVIELERDAWASYGLSQQATEWLDEHA